LRFDLDQAGDDAALIPPIVDGEALALVDS
jgi:hypothetical protein